MEDFAEYILNEEDYIQKMIIACYMSEKTGIFFNKSIILRTQIAKMFLDYASLDVDKNEVLTAVLLCNCKKVDNSQKIGKLEMYAKEGADYLATLGFGKKFCKICEGLNRYSSIGKREKESDILELIDQFTGLILRRAEREAFTPQEALVILKERNLRDVDNRYLEDFILFVNAMETVYIKDATEIPVLRKLAFLCEREHSTKSYIAVLQNRYAEEIDKLMKQNIEKTSKELFSVDEKKEKNNITTTTVNNAKEKSKKLQTVHRYTRVIQKNNANKALFSKDVADRIMKHESIYKIEN